MKTKKPNQNSGAADWVVGNKKVWRLWLRLIISRCSLLSGKCKGLLITNTNQFLAWARSSAGLKKARYLLIFKL
jgi:hypothetical protein